MSIVFMFSGQGSQYYQMGSDLYEVNPVFKEHLNKLDQSAYSITGKSVLSVIYAQDKGLSDVLDDHLLSSFAIYAIEMAMFKTLTEYGVKPDLLLGSSFGTLVASVASGYIDEDEALGMLENYCQVFQDHCEPGCMLGILAPRNIYDSNSELMSLSEMAGINFRNSFVLSLPERNLSRVAELLDEIDVTFQRLPVARAFHSKWIDNAESNFLKILSKLRGQSINKPLICTSIATQLTEINGDAFWRAVRAPMQFYRTIAALEHSGPHQYIDVGPSGTLTTYLKYILTPESKSTFHAILSPFKRAVTGLESLTNTMSRNR